MRSGNTKRLGFIIVVLLSLAIFGLFTLSACGGDTDKVETDVARLSEDLEALKQSLEILQLDQVSSRGFDPTDANHATDAPRRGDTFIMHRVSEGSIVIDVSVVRQPASSTLYLWLQLTPEGQQPKWVRAGEIKTNDQGAGTLKVNIPTAPGVYAIGGIASNVDKETGPYTGRVYICVPGSTVLVT